MEQVNKNIRQIYKPSLHSRSGVTIAALAHIGDRSRRLATLPIKTPPLLPFLSASRNFVWFTVFVRSLVLSPIRAIHDTTPQQVQYDSEKIVTRKSEVTHPRLLAAYCDEIVKIRQENC
jgi:hypothetical protein